MATLTREDIVKLLPENTANQTTTQDIFVDLKHPAKVFHVFRKEAYRLPSLSPDNVKKMELLSGRWDQVGSVRECTYVVQGLTGSLVDQVVKVDDASKEVAYRVLGGEVTHNHKNVYAMLKIVDGSEFHGRAQWILAFDKNDPSRVCAVDPQGYLNVLKAVTEDVDKHLH